MIAKFEFDSNKGIVKINDSEPILSVTDIKIERKKGERYSSVTLKLDADVLVEGKLVLVPTEEILKVLEKNNSEGEC